MLILFISQIVIYLIKLIQHLFHTKYYSSYWVGKEIFSLPLRRGMNVQK